MASVWARVAWPGCLRPIKATLKQQLTAEVMGALRQRPDLRVVTVADGAPDNWSYLGETLPFGLEVRDFYHAAEHLDAALAAAYGEGTPTYQARVETLSTVLSDEPHGVDKVIGALRRLRMRYPRRQAIHKALAYCRDHCHRMCYADLRAHNLPIGSGVVEAACKTLVSQRLKRSGTPATFTAEQIVQRVAVACEDPADSGRPLSHWTPREVADEVRKRGIVETISTRSVGRFLKSGRLTAASGGGLAQCQAG